MPVLLVLFGLTIAGTGWVFLNHELNRRAAIRGTPVGHDPGTPVEVEFLGDGAVVKVYHEHNAYSAHVYWRQEFRDSAGGFGNVPAAVGWGRSYARSLGADV